MEQFFKDSQQLWGLGPYQNRTDQAAVTHLHLVCLADALLPHLRIMRPGAQGQRRDEQAADWSTAVAQEQLRGWMGDDIIADLKAQPPDEPVLIALERLRGACKSQSQST